MGSGAPSVGKRSVAEINGTAIGINDYMDREKNLREFYKLNAGGQSLDAEMERQISSETWRRLVRETIMDRSYQQLGIQVSSDELKTMVTGDQSMGMSGNPALSEPHPIIRQMFSNPETGMLNRTVMSNYFNALDNPQFAQEKKRWLFIENEIVSEKMNEKYLNMVRKGFQPSSLDLKDYAREEAKSADFSYISRPFSEITDDQINFTESDVKEYYRIHKENYKQQAGRTFQYVAFEVQPSDKDVESARYWSEQTKAEYMRQEGEEIPRYVNGSSDEPFNPMYYTYEELPENIRDSVFNASQDQVFGPYQDEESFKLARAYDTQMRPDSVRARHILLGDQAYQGNRNAMRKVADSLVNLINNGSSFNQLAMEHSVDESNRTIGGDLGWFQEGQMVTEFNDACFGNKKGELVTAETQFGIHIIRIEEQSRPVKKVQMATVVRHVYASDETNQDYYNRAVKFRGKATNLESFTEQAREFGLDPRFAPNITKDQQVIPGIEQASSVIKWAYTSEVNSVSNIFSQPDEKYIVAVLTESREQGYAELESVRPEIELAVKKQKKAEELKNQMNEALASVTDLNQYGSANNLNVGEAAEVKFANTYVPGIGLEPYIVGASMYLPLEQISQPLVGESGVFVLSLTNRSGEEAASEVDEATRSRLKYTMESRSNYEAYNALVDAAEVEDNRLDIFY